MKVIDPGHEYQLGLLDTPPLDYHESARIQALRFVKHEGEGYPGNTGNHEGTTSQEVLRCLVDRAEYLNRQVPCAETESAIGLLKAALVLFELRAARRHERTLESYTVDQIVKGQPCPSCLHIGCSGTCRKGQDAKEKQAH